MPKPYREILVMACSRSGTYYTAEYLTGMGLDVGHERINADGACGWPYAVSEPYIRANGRRDEYEWGVIVHQVRHPLSTISSMLTHEPPMIGFVSRHLGGLPDDMLHAAMLYWIGWNELIEHQTDIRYRVEDLWPHGPADRLLRGSLPTKEVGQVVRPPSARTNARAHPDKGWADLERKDLRASRYIYRMAHKYGYTE